MSIASPRQAPPFGLLPLALLLALPLAGCGGGGGNGGGSSSPATTPTPAPAPLSVSAVTPDGLTATLAENAATVAVGGSVTYTSTLTNSTSQSITFRQAGGDTSSVGDYLQIVNPSGQTVFPAAGNGTGTSGGPISLPITLAPGQSSSGTVAASGVFTAAGSYTVTATFSIIAGSPGTTADTAVGPLTVTVQ